MKLYMLNFYQNITFIDSEYSFLTVSLWFSPVIPNQGYL